MSDEAFSLPTPPLMTAERARDIARDYRALAGNLAQAGVRSQASQAERQSHWWLTYSLTLAATKSEGE